MGEPKPLASLSAGLLARKGGARPAMRRQPLGSGPVPMGQTGYDDLGWNDMGYDVDPAHSDDATRVDLKPLLPGSMMPHDAAAQDDLSAGSNLDPSGEEVVPEAQAPQASAPASAAEPASLAPMVDALAERASRSASADIFAADPPEVVRQQKSLKDRVAAVARKVESTEAPAPKKSGARGGGSGRGERARDKAAFTLRLDAERHLRLRLASAITNRSAQTILIELLDDYLASLPEIDAMASRLPAAPPARKTKASARNKGD
ncbi:hypothetical protein [Sphingopyxis sp. MWB1]|uniref:hypothetical protein n=1 Tax=Sphingopyxis sp. MWB1 TaxID=1537715 RepID=UPI000519F2A0|nr:hypothetical protein [Sphingopyxis sp. MWB1]